MQTRRGFCERTALATLGAALAANRTWAAVDAARKFTLCLSPGSIGVKADQARAIELAQRHGFESVEPFAGTLAAMNDAQLAALLTDLKAKQLVFGAAGVPVEFRRDEAKFADDLAKLPPLAKGLQRAGVTRAGTWLLPSHNELTYLQNFKQHARRLREVARVLQDSGVRFGLEYVGPFTSRARQRFNFAHTLVETLELIAEIGLANVGVILDSWHWHNAGETAADLLKLAAAQIVSADLNDAPAGVPTQQLEDGKRELPAATGVINLAGFLNALRQLGYDGPIRAEPFNKALNDLEDEPACAATIAALRKAAALLG